MHKTPFETRMLQTIKQLYSASKKVKLRNKSYLTMILLLEKELTIYCNALSDIGFLSYKNNN